MFDPELRVADRPGGTAARRLRVVPTTKKGPSKRLQQGAKSRDEILDAAMRMMSVRGFDGTSIADIARESGLPNSSIYWHFNSKAGILAAVMERGAERFFADVAPQPLPAGRHPGRLPAPQVARVGRGVRDTSRVLATVLLLMLSNDNPDVTEIVQRVRDHGRGSLHARGDRLQRLRSGGGAQGRRRNRRLRARRIRRHLSGDADLPQRSVERLVDQVAVR